MQVLQRRKSAMNGKTTTTENNYEKVLGGKIKLKPFMDLLLELAMEKGVFTDKEIRDHVDTMIVGGHDTSANVLMFTLILLGSHPEVQKKVFEESVVHYQFIIHNKMSPLCLYTILENNLTIF